MTNNILDWTIKDLERWVKKIENKAKEFGLNFFEQIFEICSHKDMIGYMSYTGLPSSYPHWSFGKAFERIQTLYNYGVTGLPYEMVINSNPCLAYLMQDNALPMQLLTIAHVYGHNDFLANNIHFKHTRPELLLERMKIRADRIRSYIKHPSIGPQKVEDLLDCARALALQRSPYFGIKKPPRKEGGNKKVPFKPEPNILIFIRDNNPRLEEWEKDILTIIDEEAQYFIPQIETKIMNEGWAVYWHYKILKNIGLPEAIYLGFIKNHNRLLARPKQGMSINPYYVGFKIWQDIEKRWDKNRLFFSREVDRDISFLRQYLTMELMKEMDIYEHRNLRLLDDRIIARVSDEENWKKVRETLIKNIGINTIPSIKIVDANFKNSRTLLLQHNHDGRDLEKEYALKTVQYIRRLWKGPVFFRTIQNGKNMIYKCQEKTKTM